MCAVAGTFEAEEQHQCFNARTANRMDLVFSVDSREYLVDVITIDANNPYNGVSFLALEYHLHTTRGLPR